MILELAEKIWNRGEFKSECEKLMRVAIQDSLKIETITQEDLTVDSIRRLLQSATILAGTNEARYRETAYRIAISTWMMYGNEVDNLSQVIQFIFSRMGNFPSRTLFEAKYLMDEGLRMLSLPLTLLTEVFIHEEENSIILDNENILILTDFQRKLWEQLKSGNSIAMSAPTSSGKSFALQNYLVSETLRYENYVAVYLVPTRALINQVSTSLKELINKNNQSGLAVSTVPAPYPDEKCKTIIYVLTQERLQILTESNPDISFDLIIVDESQIISEDSRGIILQTVIEKILKGNPETQVMFAAPLTENPEVFSATFGLADVFTINEEECPVAQNLLFLDVEPNRPNEINIKTYINQKYLELGKKISPIELFDTNSTLAFTAWMFGKDEKNLVYAGGQAACETLANMIAELCLNNQTDTFDDELEEFSKFIKEYIHPQYILATTIKNGVAFHYGNMPAIVRKAIEDLFVEGKINYLACTSTLLHGINLPAKNLFMLNPTKGRVWGSGQDIPISSIEFWNLAGRAGRLGKDFEGNVFLINLSSWEENPLEGTKKQIVKPSLNRQLTDNGAQLVEFIKNKNHSSGENSKQGLENTFVKLFNEFKSGDLENRLNDLDGEIDLEIRNEIVNTMFDIEKAITVPGRVLERNITISPFRQQEMLDYLVAKIGNDGPDRFIPLHPLADWNRVYESLWRILKRIHSRFEGRPGKDRSNFYFAGLALRWMRGEHLSRLIDDAYKHRLKVSKRDPSIATVIRDVMQSIEQDLRFRYVKYTNCYIDLLKEALTINGYPELSENIPNIPLFLELGASSQTMVSFIGLGLSRTTASILTDKTVLKNMDGVQAFEWLLKQNFESLGVPKLCIKEINGIVGL